ncbi:MAG: hypothetical protein KGJ11_06010, partial [Candidatus Omnitrophica bacterium]|nr:hypothetical protein [Candidatus Omnitrophota bacterium]
LIIPEFSAYFIAGAAFFLIYKEGIDVYKTLLLLGSLLLALYRGWEYAILASEQFLTVFKPGIILGCICLFYLIFLFIALRKTSFIRSRFFIFLGSLTYPFYLIHQDLGLIIFKLEHAFFDPHVLLGVTLILMLMVTWLIHSKIEKQYSPELKKALEKNLDFSWLRFKLNRLAFSTNDIDKPAP